MKDVPIAYYGESAFSGFYIFKVDDDFIKFRYWCNGEYSRLCTSKIRYAKGIVPYFMAHSRRLYLDDFMRCGCSDW